MPRRCYQPKQFTGASKSRIEKANEIIAEYQQDGFQLTLRQLYYQFVARGLLGNAQKEYKNLGELINSARLAGLVDWESIVDRTRHLRSVGHWETPGDIIDSAANSFRLDKWKGQPRRIEVWVEKDALVGVIEGACEAEDVPFFSCRGYTSQSELWVAANRMRSHLADGQTPIVLHFGDHDPSGLDMTRDIRERLSMFVGSPVEVERLALNMDQVKEYNLPPNPAKLTDSRCKRYMVEYGDESWELDALDPHVLAALVRGAIARHRIEPPIANGRRRKLGTVSG